jgi:hypothetical protein
MPDARTGDDRSGIVSLDVSRNGIARPSVKEFAELKIAWKLLLRAQVNLAKAN